MHGSSIFTLYQPISTMRIFGYLCVDFHVLIISAIYCSCASGTEHQASSLSRSSFPPGFVFGAGSSAYQVDQNNFLSMSYKISTSTFYRLKVLQMTMEKDRVSGILSRTSTQVCLRFQCILPTKTNFKLSS